jgi:hypothetical protein
MIPAGQDKKFIAFIKKGLETLPDRNSAGGASMTQGNPLNVYDFVQKLEKRAYSIGGRSISLTAQDKALQQAYLSIADELKGRLFQQANQNISDVVSNPELINQLSDVSPKLAEKFSNVKTLEELRSLAAPFVRGGKATAMTELGNNLSTNTTGGAFRGAAKYVPSVTDPLAPLKGLMESNSGLSAIGGVERKAGQNIQRLSSKLDILKSLGINTPVGQVSSRLFSNGSPQPNNESNQGNPSPENNISGNQPYSKSDQLAPPLADIIQPKSSATGYTEEQLAQGYAKAVMAGDTKAASKIKTLLDIETANVKRVTGKALSTQIVTKLAAADSANSILDQIESSVSTIGQSKYGPLARIIGPMKNLAGKTGFNEDVSAYNDFVRTIKPGLAKSLGQVGNLTATEQKDAIAMLENATSMSQTEFNKKIGMLRDLINKNKENLLIEANKTAGQ